MLAEFDANKVSILMKQMEFDLNENDPSPSKGPRSALNIQTKDQVEQRFKQIMNRRRTNHHYS